VKAAGRPLNKRTTERLAACETVGLHYWADHPAAGHVWAVDDHQHAHVVRVSPDGAQHVCRECAAANQPLASSSNPLQQKDVS